MYHFNSSNRYVTASKTFHESNSLSMDEFLLDYTEAVKLDVQKIMDSALPHIFLLSPYRGNKFNISVDSTNLSFDISIYPEQNHYDIEISLGAIIAMDDAASTIARLLLPRADVIWDRMEEFNNIESRFCDYTFLLEDATLGGAKNFMYAYSVIFKNPEDIELSLLLANYALIWIVCHEIGHVQLGHLAELDMEQDAAFRDNPIYTSKQSISPESFFKLRVCQEFAADTYASNVFFSAFMRKDSIRRKIFPEMANNEIGAVLFLLQAASIANLLLHRTQKSTLTGGDSEIGTYPDPVIRLFNVLAVFSPAVDNNQRIIGILTKEFTGENLALDISLPDLLFPFFVISGIIDEFLRYISSFPILPWKKEMAVKVSEKRTTKRHEFKQNDSISIVEAECEFVAAVLYACRGYAEFNNFKELKKVHESWKNLVIDCSHMWSEQINQAHNNATLNLFHDWMPGEDVQVLLTLLYFHEISDGIINEDIELIKSDYTAFNEQVMSFRYDYFMMLAEDETKTV